LFLAQFCDALVGISMGAALFLIAVKVLEVSAYKVSRREPNWGRFADRAIPDFT
jgi:hypothetical protein